MTLLTLNALIATLFFSCLSTISPINLGVTVLAIALIMSIMLAMITSSWFGFITFIIYVGGMLVMFAYFAALQPNQHITNWNWLLTPTWCLILLYILTQNTSIVWPNYTPDTMEVYSMTNMILPVFLALILFLALIVVVKTARADEGPLRPFKYV
uniref:NADH dehydrogenase subunit 6 n=2 Tax=Platynereis cf. australis PA-2020 TaxID=2759233 RepID=A0A7G9UIY6_9ANNE|nr:NADH dehydrogenase subunit 6 [Platynereis cf. australis PA-2020]QNN93067.1 NADH dehydrogenase subunit 6 [Platynereis cf. australis PA-2020]QNN93093.1 NADH dehydrogenase subunit 6 [Platynereis cf. australis PA-2020]